MRCLVTGATGYLGSFLTRLLVAEGHDVAVLVRPSASLEVLSSVVNRITVIRGDLGDLSPCRYELHQAAPDTVFHLAWSGVTADARNLPHNVSISVTGSLRLFEILRDAGCSSWIGLGSQAEYGFQDAVLDESSLPAPETPYGVAKLGLGSTLAGLSREAGIRFVWLRLFAAYGPADDGRHLIPFLISGFLRNERVSLNSSGDQQWDYLFVRDAVEAICLAGVSASLEGVFNLAYGESIKVRALAEEIQRRVNPACELCLGEARVPSLRADILKIRTALNWAPRTNLMSGLDETIEWYRSRNT